MATLWSRDIADNPLAFVMYAFPWGQEGTPLERYTGPKQWQRDHLEAMRLHIADNRNAVLLGDTPSMMRDATASGRGIGKSALVSWVTLWMQSCVLGSTTIITANTEQQLKSRTWAEIGKWHTLAINGHWFQRDTLSLRPAPWFGEACRARGIDTGYYYAQGQLWTEENPDAFAGAHNDYGLQLIMDEASGIPSPIYDVSEGFFTEPTTHRFWFQFSNPRKTTGGFFDAFHGERTNWTRKHIDAREVEGSDMSILQGIIDKYGEDSDQAAVEVKGMFPRTGEKQFIGRELVQGAMTREPVEDKGAPLVLGVDVARFGDDRSVLAFRHGRDARSIPWQDYKGLDVVQLADHVARAINRYDPDMTFVDGGGVGGGVVDILKSRGFRVVDVQFGRRADEPNEYMNHRAEMWGRMRNWLGTGSLPSNMDLLTDLTAPEYRFAGDQGAVILESKEEIKKRHNASPDWADALAVTFSVPVARRDRRSSRQRRPVIARGVGASPFS